MRKSRPKTEPKQASRLTLTEDVALDKRKALAALSMSPHGDLSAYLPLGVLAEREADWYAHVVAWNALNGSVRDSKIALPSIALVNGNVAREHEENALAHLAQLSPRDLVRALAFVNGRAKHARRLVRRYLKAKEGRGFDRTAMFFRDALKTLYATFRIKPGRVAADALFNRVYVKGSALEAVSRLHCSTSAEIALLVHKHAIPHTIAWGALGARGKDVDVVAALMRMMSPTDIITNQAMLERRGLTSSPLLRGIYEEKLAEASKSTKAPTLKTQKAIASTTDDATRERLRDVQKKQIELVSLDANVLVIVDKSGSMQTAIATGRYVAAALAAFVKGRVELDLVDTAVRAIDVTGKDYDAIARVTANVTAGGGTWLGAPLERARQLKTEYDVVILLSDGADHGGHTSFVTQYASYASAIKEPTVYFYRLRGTEPDSLSRECDRAGIALNIEDWTSAVPDYYSIPDIVKRIRVNRFSLIDDVWNTPLLTLDAVLRAA